MGEILGYPSCCIRAFVSDLGSSQAGTKGVIHGPDRSPLDVERIEHEISKMLGYRWTTSNEFRYDPCDAHVGSPGYHDCEGNLAEVGAANLGLVEA